MPLLSACSNLMWDLNFVFPAEGTMGAQTGEMRFKRNGGSTTP